MSHLPTITVASYNMRKAIGTDRRRLHGRVLDVINEIDADVIALQEADRRFGGRGSAVPHDLISGKSGYKPVVFGVSHSRLLQRIPYGHHAERLLKLETRNIGWHGNALLVKNEVDILDFAILDLPMLEPRGGRGARRWHRGSRCCHRSTLTSAGFGGGGRCAASSSRSRRVRGACPRC